MQNRVPHILSLEPLLILTIGECDSKLLYIAKEAFVMCDYNDLSLGFIKYRNKKTSNTTKLCNTWLSSFILGCLGTNAPHVNHNNFVYDNIFKVKKNEKIYNAIYIAQAYECKRIELSALVKNMCWITYGGTEEFRKKHLSVGNIDFVNNYYFSREECCEKINQSWCGLALSAKEGAMLAATEYLMCGLPVVSTNSLGGRMEWFNNKNSIICAANSIDVNKAVNRAIDMVKSGDFNSEEISRETKIKAQNGRIKFFDIIKNKYGIDLSHLVDCELFFKRALQKSKISDFVLAYKENDFNKCISLLGN